MPTSSKARILRLIEKHKHVTRGMLSGISGYSILTTSRIVSLLIDEGLVIEGDTIDTSSGRKPTALEINNNYGHVIAIDIGAGSIKFGIVDICGRVLEKEYIIPANNCIPATYPPLESMLEIITRMNEKHTKSRCIGIGIGVSGIIDDKGKIIKHCPNIRNLDNLNITEFFESRMSLPVFLDTSARCLALGEMNYGMYNQVNDLMLVSIGYSIQLGIIINHNVYRGFRGVAGEFGHMRTMSPKNGDKMRCSCGCYNCLEMYATAPMIRAEIIRDLKGFIGYSPARNLIKDIKEATYDELRDAYLAGDKIVSDCVAQVAELLGVHLAALTNIMNPEVIVVTGKVIEMFPGIVDEIEQIVNRLALTPSIDGLKVTQSALNEDRAVIGAATQVIRSFFDEQE